MSDYPERWDFHPKQRKFEGGITFREAGVMDFWQLRQLFRDQGSRRPSVKMWDRWLKSSGYLVVVAVRNGRNIVGATVTRHTRGVNEVLAYAFRPTHLKRFDVRQGLFTYAMYEMPEYETTVQTPEHDVETQKELRRLGAKANNEYLFRFSRVVAFRSKRDKPPVAETGSADSTEAAGSGD